ncbi:MAG: helix-turn-helix domain-containing protein [Sphingobacteriales bacterium]|nr:helix-turn-helix domain-containing protein [Sphingobacteriales bacterium]
MAKIKTVATFPPDISNTLFQLAADLINQSGRNIFLTGKAGTGKTTFLKYIRDNCPKQMAVVAPTGVAAINAGGVTIHSFFQLPLSPFIPVAKSTGFSSGDNETTNRHSLIGRMRVNNEKRKLWQQLELLIIDEVSMVRCDTMDAVDTVLRHFRRRPYEKFGGVQVLFIGDMFQLPPVVKDAEWQLFGEYYDSPYFFSSQVIKEEPPLYIEFDKIYRQSEEKFIRVLNQVRNNELDEEGMSILESRFQPSFRRSKEDGYIVLTTHNEQARNINLSALQNLEGKAQQYEAEIKNDFPENAYPAEVMLYLKVGAQVMFIKNDTADRGKRYFNGKIGTVTKLEEDNIYVRSNDDGQEIAVEREEWENIRYTVDKTTQQMKEDKLGSFTQFPLRLAWAITIHKSQGLTFDKAIIDAGEAFAPGQVYVALSRCTSLNGLVLKSRIQANRLFTDQRIVQFSQNISSSKRIQNELEQSRKHYQEKLLLSSFDFRIAINNCNELQQYLLENSSSFNPETITWLLQVTEKIIALQDTAVKFHQWLKEQFALPLPPEENKALQERTARAASHFVKETEAIINELQQSPAVTDSKQHAKEYNEALKEVFTQLSATKHLLQGFGGTFSPSAWHQRKKNFILPSFNVNAYAGASQKRTDSPHPALHKQLRELRDNICSRKNLPIYLVLGSVTLDEMARYLPQSLAELRKISGFGDVKLEQYGQQFLDIIVSYCKERNLSSLIHEKFPKRERKERTGPAKKKGDSYAETFGLYKEGKTIADIAKERNLAISTIEGHLCKFIRNGDISIHEVVSQEKFVLIDAALKDFDGTSTTPVKQKLPPEITFGEIKMVMAGLGITQHHSTE